MKLESLEPGSLPCIRCGFCCKKAPCGFGEWDEEKKQCIHLQGENPGNYVCGIAAWITEQPGAAWMPAFGAGCCAALYKTTPG